MYNYYAEFFTGKDGKEYVVGAEKLERSMGANKANYEVKYMEYQEHYRPKQPPCPSWLDSNCRIVGRYKSPNPVDAIIQGREELRNQGIHPPIADESRSEG